MTVVELITQLFHLDKSFRIIVATPSNSAAYSLTESLIDSSNKQGFRKQDLIRIVSNGQIEKDLVPDFLEDFCVTVSADENQKPMSSVSFNCFSSKNK